MSSQVIHSNIPHLPSSLKHATPHHLTSDRLDAYPTPDTLATYTHFQPTLPQFHNSAAILADYAHSLVQRGQFSQAAEKMLKAFDISPAMLKYLEEAIYFYGLAGHFHRVGDLLKTWDKLSPLLHHPFSKLACEMIDFMDKKNVEDVLLENLINVAISVLLQNQRPVLPYQFHISLKEDEESQWVHYGIPVCDISEAEIVKLDFELVDSLVEANLPVNLTGCFVTSYEALGVE